MSAIIEDYTDTSPETLARRAENLVAPKAVEAPIVATTTKENKHQGMTESFFGRNPDWKQNTLCFGDNLGILNEIPKESIDLIYLDPPFNKNKIYTIVDKSGETGKEEARGFYDKWKGGTQTYLDFLYERVLLMKSLLKPTGSFYLHCDPTESHYIKVKVLDEVFGRNNFRNEIVWCYTTSGKSKNYFNQKHDVIFFYSKSNEYNFTEQRTVSDKNISRYNKTDAEGNKYYMRSGKYKVTWTGSQPVNDYWIDIPALTNNEAERVGYPTQKPVALMERIIRASSNPGDMVLDPFMGSGTTGVAAIKLGRKFIGVDKSASALSVAIHRIHEISPNYDVFSNAISYNYIRTLPPFDFERRIVEWIEGIPNTNQIGDKGIDGRIFGAFCILNIKDKVIIESNSTSSKTAIQVKRSDHVGPKVIDEFKSAIEREGANIGILIAFSFTSGSHAEVSRLKREGQANITLIEVKDIVLINEPPVITLEVDGKNIKAVASSPDGEIVNYAWAIDGEIVKLVDMTGLLEISEDMKEDLCLITCRATNNGGGSTKVFYTLEKNILAYEKKEKN